MESPVVASVSVFSNGDKAKMTRQSKAYDNGSARGRAEECFPGLSFECAVDWEVEKMVVVKAQKMMEMALKEAKNSGDIFPLCRCRKNPTKSKVVLRC